VVLHALDILIHEETVVVTSGATALNVVGVGYDFDREFVVFHLDAPLVPGQTLSLQLKFVR
jgi:hypothetical protein